MSFSTETLTKAEQLADECDNFGHGVEPLNISVVESELRRLSLMEAELTDEKLHVKQLERGLDKLLAVNKMLVEAFEKQLRSIPALQDGGGFVIDHCDCNGEYIGSQNIDPLHVVQELCSIANAALKLAGEIK